jgi:dTDP-4-amino-4,6-dideoxygalactose transaminase
MIPFNKPYFTGKEVEYIKGAMYNGKVSGDGIYTKMCHDFFEKKYNFKKVLLTTSGTHALEMAAILLDIKDGDEVIVPSYTFVSTVNAFVLRGAKIIFIDSTSENPNMDVEYIEKLITPKTKVIVTMHYAGIACDMDKIIQVAEKYNLFVVEDAALAIDSFYKNKPLGSIGHLAAFSFHETKNISSGEGGMLVINDARFINRAEIIREKGTNRSAFFRGEVDKYGWVDIGSSFLPSDMIAAFLFAQLEQLDVIQNRRKSIWEKYYNSLKPLQTKDVVRLPITPEYATNNGNIFYIICNNLEERTRLIKHLKQSKIDAAFHYQSLHKSEFFLKHNEEKNLPYADLYSNCLLRLPLYFELSESDQNKIIEAIHSFYL